ncbi:uncharacterized protein M6B38_168690 [Iris pallida]|uniref:Uncharacterized protein n=1 Tax=Iris pallida TaxID=29817 RepID=A0AAX6EVC8_IRIPA|nr:uncharacterized protein M6B38_168690 [Iris pallida]
MPAPAFGLHQRCPALRLFLLLRFPRACAPLIWTAPSSTVRGFFDLLSPFIFL